MNEFNSAGDVFGNNNPIIALSPEWMRQKVSLWNCSKESKKWKVFQSDILIIVIISETLFDYGALAHHYHSITMSMSRIFEKEKFLSSLFLFFSSPFEFSTFGYSLQWSWLFGSNEIERKNSVLILKQKSWVWIIRGTANREFSSPFLDLSIEVNGLLVSAFIQTFFLFWSKRWSNFFLWSPSLSYL